LGEIVPLPGKRKRGRPRRAEPPVDYTLRFTRQQAAYLTYLADVAGWAPSANLVAKGIVAARINELMAAGFHERGHTLPTNIDDSADDEG
jgi:hypothetical protein